MNNDIEAKNQSALESLAKNDFYQAQITFRDNAKRNPCFITLNNLGVFYVHEGIAMENGRMRSAVKQGIKLLVKAGSFRMSGSNLAAIARAYLKLNNFEMATNYYDQAIKEMNNYALYNNCGVALYQVNQYEKASIYFSKALDICPNHDEKLEIIISYAYASLEIDKMQCNRIINDLTNASDLSSQMLDIEKFVLLYLCDDFVSASVLCRSLFDRYHIDSCVLAMIFDCLFCVGKDDEAKECFDLQIELLQGYDYDISKEMQSVNLAFISHDYRKKLISEYRYIPAIIEQCFYSGCKQHGDT